MLRKPSLCLGFLILCLAGPAPAQIRTILVSPVPGDPVASGTGLRNALAGISSPSSTNRWLVKIEPGIYDVAATSLLMRSWVDVEGSGIGTTTIRGTVDGSSLVNATIHGASSAELRLVTVEATGTAEAIAMYNEFASPRLYRVKLLAQGSAGAWGMRNFASAPIVEECEIAASTSSPTGSNAYGIVFRGVVATGQRSSIVRSKIDAANAASNYGLFMMEAQTVTEIRDSKINATGGSNTYGIYATFGPGGWTGQENLALRDVEVSSAGGSSASYGALLDSNSWVAMSIMTSTLWGHVSPATYGIVQRVDAPMGLQGASVTGFTKTIDTAGSISIASTHLQGGPTTALGWLGCMGVWDENGVFYANSCPP